MQTAFKLEAKPGESLETPLPHVGYDLPQEKFCGLALVGEAPGAEEVRQGHPFVGRSGQLLDKMLVGATIERKKCLVANVFRYQPPGNKVDHFFMSRRAAQNAGVELAEELGLFSGKYCQRTYAEEIESLANVLASVKPKIIVALGRTPFWALTGENGLLSKVGEPLPCRLLKGVNVIATYHPSFILRGNWKLQPEWLAHFQKSYKYCS